MSINKSIEDAQEAKNYFNYYIKDLGKIFNKVIGQIERKEYVDIPTGSILKMIRPDGDKSVDLEMPSGDLVRLEIVSGKDYGSAYGRGIIVSGEYVEQYNVFEVLMFAQ